MAQTSNRIDPDAPYVLMGYQMIDILTLLQGMPRSTDNLCRRVEAALSQAQLLQASTGPQPGMPQDPSGAEDSVPSNVVQLPNI